MSERADRQYAEIDKPGSRSPYARDRDRIRHSAAFQRLGQITQVMAPNGKDGFHTRRSHSLEVARIGKALAEALLARPDGAEAAMRAGGLDPAVIEAAALAHDLGHPPFGHDAEDELDRLLTESGLADGFEANAQSFRVVCKLAEGGLNLTRATLAAILKYPWRRGESVANPGKWGAYDSEAGELAWAGALMPPGSQTPTLEAALVDWADLIAYAAHDCEDFLRVGLIPFARLESDAAERERFLELVTARRRIPATEQQSLAAMFDQLLTGCPLPELPASTRAGRTALRCFIHRQIDTAIGATSITTGVGGPHLSIEPEAYRAILLLEGLTWHYVIDSGLLANQRQEQRRVIRAVFERLADAVFGRAERTALPVSARSQLHVTASDRERLRVVSDAIASLTEVEAVRWSQ